MKISVRILIMLLLILSTGLSFLCTAKKKATPDLYHPNLQRFKEHEINQVIITAWENFSRQKYEAAALDFERLIKKDYVDYDILYGAGISFYMTNKIGKSIEYLDRAIKERPDHYEALFLRAKIHLRRKKRVQALWDLKEILLIDYDKTLVCGFYFHENDISTREKLETRKKEASKLIKSE